MEVFIFNLRINRKLMKIKINKSLWKLIHSNLTLNLSKLKSLIIKLCNALFVSQFIHEFKRLLS